MLSSYKEIISKKILVEQLSIPEDLAIKSVEDCKKKKEGDFSVPVPKIMRNIKTEEKNPVAIAKELLNKIVLPAEFTKVTQTGPYLNFTVNKPMIIKQILEEVMLKQESYGCKDIGNGKNVVIDFSSPNIAKPFHAGHLRSTIIGNFVGHIHKAFGFNVISLNWLGDWGSQFGLLALGFEKYGSEEELKNNAIKHLYDIYVKINKDASENEEVKKAGKEFFSHMEKHEEEYLKRWRLFRALSIEELKKTYARLHVTFDVFTGESETDFDIVDDVLKQLKEKGISKIDKGCTVVDLEKYKLGVAMLTKDDGSSLYITRDLASAIKRHNEYNFEKSYYVVAYQQNLHFQQLFKMLELLGYDWSKKCYHVPFGMVKGMSTRKGTAVFLHDILDDAKQTMLENMEKNKDKVAEI